MSYRPYKDLTTEKIVANLSTLRYELKNIRPSNSGQASNYYAPAIHYHEEELRLRGLKVCRDCGKAQSLEAFYDNPRMNDGKLNRCTDCELALRNQRSAAPEEEVAELSRLLRAWR